MRRMNIFEFWTKKDKVIGAILLLIAALLSVGYAFVTDFDTSKQQTLDNFDEEYVALYNEQNAKAVEIDKEVDALALESDNETVKQDAMYREDFETMASALVALSQGVYPDGYSEKSRQHFVDNNGEAVEQVQVTIDKKDDKQLTGTVYFLDDSPQVYNAVFNRESKVIDSLTYVGDTYLQRVTTGE